MTTLTTRPIETAAHDRLYRQLRQQIMHGELMPGQPLTLPDVPKVERVHVAITELLFSDDRDNDRRELGE